MTLEPLRIRAVARWLVFELLRPPGAAILALKGEGFFIGTGPACVETGKRGLRHRFGFYTALRHPFIDGRIGLDRMFGGELRPTSFDRDKGPAG